MGSGSYSSEAHMAITTKRATRTRQEVFKETGCHPDMNPKGVDKRESRDSDNHPESIGIIFALDETGSMASIPFMLAQEKLPLFMQNIIDGGYVPDPQLAFFGIGDVFYDRSPLQVGQFESEAELMDKWLTAVHLEGNGGGNDGESYDMAFYFAARHTSMDCFEKRGRKGYLFVTGDEPALGVVNAEAVRNLCGDDLKQDIPIQEIINEASQTFHCFFIIPDKFRAERCERGWRDLLGDNVVVCEDPRDVCDVASTLIGLNEGSLENLDAAAKTLGDLGCSKNKVNRVIRAVEPFAGSIGSGGKRRHTIEQPDVGQDEWP